MTIHPSSFISSSAKLGKNVHIGPFCYVGENVELADNVTLQSHVAINCRTTVGEGTTLYPFVSINVPQDLKFSGEDSRVIIGKNNSIREYATIHSGTKADNMKTVVGDNCLLMIGCHIAHDCIVGNNVIMANNATLGGHVVVEDGAIIGGLAAIHQNVRIGKNAIVGGMSGVERDVIPYGNARCERAFLDGLNVVGLRRRGTSKEDIVLLNKFFDYLFDNTELVFEERLQNAEEQFKNNMLIQEILSFIRKGGKRSICMPKIGNNHD